VFYRTEVWLNNKITIVVGDDRESFEKELVRLENQGGVILAKYVQENDLEEVIVCSKKGATGATAAVEVKIDDKAIAESIVQNIKHSSESRQRRIE
jgi:hypothetical protein